jgi:hypothetical protein
MENKIDEADLVLELGWAVERENEDDDMRHPRNALEGCL